MAIRNRCLARGVALKMGSRTLYTVEASGFVLLKHIGFTALSVDGSTSVEVYLKASDGTLQEILSWNFNDKRFVNQEVWFALNEGDAVVADVQTQDLRYWLSGADLTA